MGAVDHFWLMTQRRSVPAHRDLIVWQRAIDLACACYKLARQLPSSERFELAAQLRRSSSSVHANIAEGAGRRTRAELASFLSIARGSAMEVDSHTEMAVRVDLLPRADVERAQGLANEVIRMLSTMMRRIAPLK
jgi:four helix bundle protein